MPRQLNAQAGVVADDHDIREGEAAGLTLAPGAAQPAVVAPSVLPSAPPALSRAPAPFVAAKKPIR